MLLWLIWVWLFGASRPGRPRYRRVEETRALFRRHARKPAWVRREVIRLKALIPDAGCRCIAAVFNRRFAQAGR